jgi:hypothetical protein
MLSFEHQLCIVPDVLPPASSADAEVAALRLCALLGGRKNLKSLSFAKRLLDLGKANAHGIAWNSPGYKDNQAFETRNTFSLQRKSTQRENQFFSSLHRFFSGKE